MTEPDPRRGVVIERVTKTYGMVSAVEDVSLAIAQGEFVTLLGPSGCGKTTLLRLISGFIEPTSGDIRLDGESVIGVPPYRRNTSMVFQDYALFPHRTVAQNLAFGLRMRRRPKKEIGERVERMLDLLGLGGMGQRKISEISGGQSQRVALGRALIVEPSVLLLDEPLGALDLKLRKQMQDELKRIHSRLGVTFLYVTHDQEEALTMSDRIAVMRAGKIEQLAEPEAIYRRPASSFVANFIGDANLLSCRIVGAASDPRLELTTGERVLARLDSIDHRTSGPIRTLMIRPEDVKIELDGNELGPPILGTVQDVAFTGATLRVSITLQDGSQIQAALKSRTRIPSAGQPISLSWRAEDAVVLE